ncbi:hypothetical protein C8Q78DRAFT_992614 [Trametes maxima]|nr:hypothetical protein C8Q78DRAFT_992614 [Trametes maxima]
MGQDHVQDASESTLAAWPFLSKGGKFAPVFPIFVKVQDKSQADKVLQFQEAIKIIENVSEVEEQVRLAVMLPGHNMILLQYIETTTNGLYPVAYGFHSAIFVNPQETVAAATGTPKAIWRKAFASRPASSPSQAKNEPVTAISFSPTTGVLIAWIELVLQAPHANLPTLFPLRRLQPFHVFVGPRDSAITPLGCLLDNLPIFNERVFKTPGEVAQVEGLPFIYQHVRGLWGVQQSLTHPLADVTPMPSYGPMLDTMLQGFSFNTESRLAIAHACNQCSTLGEFIGAMVPQGLVALEAKFMWGLVQVFFPRAELLFTLGRPLRLHISLMVHGACKPKLMVCREAAVDHQKKLLAEKRTKAWETYANALQAAWETITEEAQKLQAEFGESWATKQKRKMSKWNAYIMHKLKLLNDTLPPSAVRFKPGDGTPKVQAILESWSAMSDAEKDVATCNLIKELDERKEMKFLSIQNISIAALHDTHATLNSSFKDFRRLFVRTRTETVVIAVRSEPDHLMVPMTFATSGCILNFLQLSLNLSLEEIAHRLEAYLLSRVPGHLDANPPPPGETTKIEIKKMYYTNFGSHITKKYGVVIDNWPLKMFVAPSKMHSRTELDILYNAFSSDVTHFQKLTHSEWEQWLTQHGRSNEVLLGEQEDTNFNKNDKATASSSQNPEPGSLAPSLLPACSPPENTLMATPSPTPPTFSPESGVPPTSPRSSASEVPIDPMLLADTTGSIRTTVAPVPPPLTTNFINTITAQDGSPLVLGASRPRKQHSDANQPCGSRKKANPSTMSIAPPTTGTPVLNNTNSLSSGNVVVPRLAPTATSDSSVSSNIPLAGATGESHPDLNSRKHGRGHGRGCGGRGSHGARGHGRSQGHD